MCVKTFLLVFWGWGGGLFFSTHLIYSFIYFDSLNNTSAYVSSSDNVEKRWTSSVVCLEAWGRASLESRRMGLEINHHPCQMYSPTLGRLRPPHYSICKSVPCDSFDVFHDCC